MTALVLENLKLAILYLLIVAIIGLSHLTAENLTKMKRRLGGQGWRNIVPTWYRS
jgi:hypothetical protein